MDYKTNFSLGLDIASGWGGWRQGDNDGGFVVFKNYKGKKTGPD